MRYASKIRTIECDFLRIELIRRRMSTTDLARKTGLSLRRVQNVICGQDRAPSPRLKINRALGVEIFPFLAKSKKRRARRISRPGKPSITHHPH